MHLRMHPGRTETLASNEHSAACLCCAALTFLCDFNQWHACAATVTLSRMRACTCNPALTCPPITLPLAHLMDHNGSERITAKLQSSWADVGCAHGGPVGDWVIQAGLGPCSCTVAARLILDGGHVEVEISHHACSAPSKTVTGGCAAVFAGGRIQDVGWVDAGL